MGNVPDRLQDPITAKDTENGEANNLRYGVSSMQGWRSAMEDSHNMIGALEEAPNISLFGVYDGHGGTYTSIYISKWLPHYFQNRKEFIEYKNLSQSQRDDVKGIKLLKSAFIATFLAIDENLMAINRASSPTSVHQANGQEISLASAMSKSKERSGSTCVVVLITPNHILCANAGDSRACFRRDSKALPLSFDHKPFNAAELSRIRKAGGIVSLKRVDGDLAVSRGLGDFQFKNRSDLPPERQKVSCIPDITIYPRMMEKDEFIVIACDGVWDVVSNEECLNMVQQIFDEGEQDIGKACEEMIDLCLKKDSRDNMSMIIVTLPAVKIGIGGGVDARRTRYKIEDITPTSIQSIVTPLSQ